MPSTGTSRTSSISCRIASEASFLVQRGREIVDLAAVEFGEIGMQAQHRLWRVLYLYDEFVFAGFEHRHLVANSFAGHAGLDGVDDARDVAFGLVQLARQLFAFSVLSSCRKGCTKC